MAKSFPVSVPPTPRNEIVVRALAGSDIPLGGQIPFL
jgi:hypothetical protein